MRIFEARYLKNLALTLSFSLRNIKPGLSSSQKAITEKLSRFITEKFQFQIWHFVQESPLELISVMIPNAMFFKVDC